MTNFIETLFDDVKALWAKVFGAEGATLAAAVINDAQLIGNGLNSALTTFQSITGLGSATITSIQAHINAIVKDATAVATAVETSVAKGPVADIQNTWTSLLSILDGVTLPEVLEDVIKAVNTLLPYIEAGVGILTASVVKTAEATGLSADEARLILGGEAKVSATEPAPAYPTNPIADDSAPFTAPAYPTNPIADDSAPLV